MFCFAVASVVESVQVTTPTFAPVVTGAVAFKLLMTVTEPHETLLTPDGVNVGAPLSQVVPVPMNVTVRVTPFGNQDGDIARVAMRIQAQENVRLTLPFSPPPVDHASVPGFAATSTRTSATSVSQARRMPSSLCSSR